MDNDIYLFLNDQDKYLEKLNNLIRYHNFMVHILRLNSNKYHHIKYIKKQTDILSKIINRSFCMTKFQLHIIKINNIFNTFLYKEGILNDDKYTTNVNSFIYVIDSNDDLKSYINNFLHYIDSSYKVKHKS